MPSDEVLALRREYQVCLKLADETDSKKEDKYLREEAAKLLAALKDKCDHSDTTVILQSHYSGSYCMDYDDRSPEKRYCLCCGTHEYTYDKFNILIYQPIARFESKYPIEIEKPLNYLLSEVTEVALSNGYRVL